MKVHTCSHCERTFTKAEHLKRHLRKHTGSRPFVCDFADCDSTFSRSDALIRHKRLHAEGRPVKSRTAKPSSTMDVEIEADASPLSSSPTLIDGIPTLSQSTSADSQLHDPLMLLSTASSSLPPLEYLQGGAADALLGEMGTTLQGTSWSAPMFEDFLTDFPLFQQGGEASAFLNSLKQSDYYNAAPSAFASPILPQFTPTYDEPFPAQDEPPVIRIRRARAIFEEVQRLCPTRPEEFSQFAEAGYTTADERFAFEGIRAELAEKPDFEQVQEPSSSFLATTLRYYWRSTHPLFPVLHRPSFRTCDHHPLLLLAMCASGAAAMAAEQSSAFAEAVMRRLLLLIYKRWEGPLGMRQRLDLLLVGHLVCRYGLYSGRRDWIQPIIGLHGACLAYARRMRLFAPGGVYQFFKCAESIVKTTDMWATWIAHESSTRLANTILVIDDWIHITARDQQPPLALGQMQIYIPSDDALFEAPTAEEWVATGGPTLDKPGTVSSWIRRLYEEENVQLPPMGSWHQHVLLFAVYTQKRCRWMSIITEPDDAIVIKDSLDPAVLRAMESWYASFHAPPLAPRADVMGDFADLNFQALNGSFTVDLDALLCACGKEGFRSTSSAINALYRGWYGRPVARRAMLHWAQVTKIIVKHAGSPIMPYHMCPGGVYAAMIILLYGLFEEHSARTNGTANNSRQASFCLTDEYDFLSLGHVGIGLIDRPGCRPASLPLTPAAQWVAYGGPAHLFHDDPLSTFAGRSMSLMTISKALSSYGFACADETAQMARCLSQAELDDS